MSAPVASGPRVFHWKHGWIPLDHFAATPPSMKGTQKAHQALSVVAYDNLSPGLREKIGKKLTALTGLPEPVLAAKVNANLMRMFHEGNQADQAWYDEQGKRIEDSAKNISDTYGVNLSKEQLVGMISATSALKRWEENVPFAEAIATKLAKDEPFTVTPSMIKDYNDWAGKRRNGAAKPHPDLTPGVYRPSALPSDFAASRTPGMPKHLNTDNVIRAVQIYHGEQSVNEVIQGPKQRSFVNNLMNSGDGRFVTVDTWHYRAAMHDIPVTATIGPKGKEVTHTYTLEQWEDMDLAVADGRALLYGYDPSQDRYSKANKKAADDATKSAQDFFQAGPSAKAEDYKGTFGTYPWFVKQTQIAAQQAGIPPSHLQAVAWTFVGGGS